MIQYAHLLVLFFSCIQKNLERFLYVIVLHTLSNIHIRSESLISIHTANSIIFRCLFLKNFSYSLILDCNWTTEESLCVELKFEESLCLLNCNLWATIISTHLIYCVVCKFISVPVVCPSILRIMLTTWYLSFISFSTDVGPCWFERANN